VNQFGLPKVSRLGLSQLLDGILVVYNDNIVRKTTLGAMDPRWYVSRAFPPGHTPRSRKFPIDTSGYTNLWQKWYWPAKPVMMDRSSRSHKTVFTLNETTALLTPFRRKGIASLMLGQSLNFLPT
jgi:hypothetical protein